MSNVLTMVKWSLIAITVGALVFQEYAVIMLAIAVVGTLLYLEGIARLQERNQLTLLMAAKIGNEAAFMHSQETQHLKQEVGRLMQEVGLQPSDFNPKSLEEIAAGLTRQAKTDF